MVKISVLTFRQLQIGFVIKKQAQTVQISLFELKHVRNIIFFHKHIFYTTEN